MSDTQIDFSAITEAAKRLEGQVINTPCNKSQTLSQIAGCELFLKFENLQFTASFKERGAYNKLFELTDEERARGVIAISAGNHAQGVAYNAQKLGIPATIVMPITTPRTKVENTEAHGARVILSGTTLEDAAFEARKIKDAENLVSVHPYDDPSVIAGQGTVGLEILNAVPDLDVLVVPIGGGGLMSGIAIAAKHIKPDIKMIGVQTELFPAMKRVFDGVENSDASNNSASHALKGGNTLAEGIAVKSPGRITREIIKKLVDDIVLVDENALEQAVSLLLNVEKTVVEGAGAAGLAAILKDKEHYKGQRVGTVLCGGNIDTRILVQVLTRTLVREGRVARIRVFLKDHPGELAAVSKVLGDAGANVLQVHHDRIFTTLPAKGAILDLEIETRGRDHLNEILTKINKIGFETEVHEVAK